jgi:hypothetical protein
VVDLFVILEGSGDEVVLEALLKRPSDLGIRAVTFKCERRSSAVRTQGPDIAREQRREFRYVICLWDHGGSGREQQPPSRVQGEVQARLNRNTLKGCSKALIIDPELEIWLWQDSAAIASALGVGEDRLAEWLRDWQRKHFPTQTVETLVRQQPKEALEEVIKQSGKKRTSTLYRHITAVANLNLWSGEASFRRLCRTLRRWFP